MCWGYKEVRVLRENIWVFLGFLEGSFGFRFIKFGGYKDTDYMFIFDMVFYFR